MDMRVFSSGQGKRHRTSTSKNITSMRKNQMSEDSSIMDISGILRQGEFLWGIVSETGMVFKDETPEMEWKRITESICLLFEKSDKTHSQAAMMLGDALRFGEEKFGEKYADVIDATREYMRTRGIEQAKNWQWVAGKIPPHLRRINLSFAHHELVAKLEQSEQEEFLKLADDEGLTVRELREKVRERHPGKPRATKVKTIVKIDTDNPESVTDALQILSNHLSNPETEILDDWKEHMEAIYKVYRRRWQNGKPKAAKKKR
jgi:hypothetical protein